MLKYFQKQYLQDDYVSFFEVLKNTFFSFYSSKSDIWKEIKNIFVSNDLLLTFSSCKFISSEFFLAY